MHPFIQKLSPKPNASYKNHFVSINEPFLCFQYRFGQLDEITPSHDYLDGLYKICHYRFCDGIPLYQMFKTYLRQFYGGILC